MKGFVLTSKGMEDISAREIGEIIGSNPEIKERCVVFPIKDLKEICVLSYKAQSIDKVMFLLDSFGLSEDFLKTTEQKFKKFELKEWVSNKKYAVKCLRIGSHDFSSADVEKKINKTTSLYFKEKYNAQQNFSNPDVVFLICIIDNACYIGIDFSGFELNKRGYKIFAHAGSLRGTIAYSAVRLSGFAKGECLLDPFVGDGVIVIEAAIYASGFPLNYYNKDKFMFLQFDIFGKDMKDFLSGFDTKETKSEIYGYGFLFKYVDYAKKNAKIAGVHDIINLSRAEIEWLDVKFKPKSMDRIVTKLPSKIPDKLVNEFFYQSHYILKDEGRVATVLHSKEGIADKAVKNNFEIEHERQVYSGQQPLWILVFKKR